VLQRLKGPGSDRHLVIYRECVVQWITNAPQLPHAVYKYLMPTERVVTAVRMHPVAIISSVLLILGGAIVAGLLTGAAGGNGGLVLAIWLLWGGLFVWQGWKVATWWRRYFVVTENRLMLLTSLLFTDVAMMPLAKVTDMRLRESAFGRMLGYGEFIVESAGQEQALSRIRFVPYPSQMYQDILSLIFPGKPAAAGPQRRPGRPRPPGRALGPSGPSWPGSPSRGPGGEASERPGDDAGF
jgi:uncharacterized membrane protein YdbT with pleckstrin-like domain